MEGRQDKRAVRTEVALGLLAISGGVLIGTTVAIVLFALGAVMLLIAGSGTETAQRQAPALGRLPFVPDRGFKVVSRRYLDLMTAQPQAETEPECVKSSGDLDLDLFSIIKDGDKLERQYEVLGPTSFVEAVAEWWVDTEQRLISARADGLREKWKEREGEEPPDGAAAVAGYLRRSLDLFREARTSISDEADIPF